MKTASDKFDFSDLFVLDLANNHQGSVAHGTAIINQCADAAVKNGVRAAIKFQFRDLPGFVHPSQREKSTNKHVPRFLSTMLPWEGFDELLAAVRKRGLLAMCTPFDEASVDRIVAMGFDIIKVASCSARDWPLLERVAGCGLPVVASTGGLLQDQIDDLVSFLEHRGCDFALMHCVSIYPTPDAACNLGNIAGFRERYRGRPIGWSTHENPADTSPVQIAAALGAELFERHVGIATDSIKLNAYSSTPEQVDQWMAAWRKAKILIGKPLRQPPLPEESVAIDELKRGVFARHPLEAGQVVSDEDVYFAFPYSPGHLSSGEWKPGITLANSATADAPIARDGLAQGADPDLQILKRAVHEVKAMLAHAHIPLSHEFTTEYSHHYGVANFRQVGAVLINVINREYCKKILVQLPGQFHPWHYHKRKEETFLVVSGELHVDVDGRHKILQPGDSHLVLPGVWHRFWTETGCIFEEISTTHFPNDSVYRDPEINKLTSAQRKTTVDHWGRFQLQDQLRSASAAPGMIRCVIFDFDGTLVDSNAVKHAAFERSVMHLPAAGEVMAAVLAETDGDRHAIFAEFSRRWSHLHPSRPAAPDQLVDAYTALTEAAVASAPEMSGATDMLDQLRDEGRRLYLNSMTPLENLSVILRRRGWLDRFDGISGAPVPKAAFLRQLMAAQSLAMTELVMVGDGADDRKAAATVGCPFIAVGNGSDARVHPDRPRHPLPAIGGLIAALDAGQHLQDLKA